MPTYRAADSPDRTLLAEILGRFHVPLSDAGVTVFFKLAFPEYDDKTGLPKGPAIRRGGLAVVATIKVNSLSDRVEGKDDATLLVDGEWWKGASDAEKRACLDGQVEYLELVLEDEDNTASVATDDANRPKLKKRAPDWAVAGFDSVIERHGAAALEAVSLAEISRRPSVKRAVA